MATKVNETQVIKFTDEEIGQINTFKDSFGDVTARLGEAEIEIITIDSQKEQIEKYKQNLKEKYIQLRESEVKLANELKDKYGEGEFDIATGIFTPKA
jgi:DNA repair exonuclease SbcCD ATPase subunit